MIWPQFVVKVPHLHGKLGGGWLWHMLLLESLIQQVDAQCPSKQLPIHPTLHPMERSKRIETSSVLKFCGPDAKTMPRPWALLALEALYSGTAAMYS